MPNSATRIVIADDEPLIRIDLRETLESLGYEVVGEAADGKHAVELARTFRPDIVIMDIKMPEMDGIAALRVLTEENIAPVLLLTAYGEGELVQQASDAGAVAYLVKPFRQSDLQPQIEVALARFGELRTLRAELDDVREALTVRKLVERAKGLLMETQGLKEAEAFRRIQKLSMDTRKSMKEVAEAILLAHQATKSS
ncbi:MAG TPA: response regulator [Chloroflexota bacterium]|nr:response regulator [Chloroflexota bacterium]HXT37341.1 response regulator [Chloroflexota bacterium]